MLRAFRHGYLVCFTCYYLGFATSLWGLLLSALQSQLVLSATAARELELENKYTVEISIMHTVRRRQNPCIIYFMHYNKIWNEQGMN